MSIKEEVGYKNWLDILDFIRIKTKPKIEEDQDDIDAHFMSLERIILNYDRKNIRSISEEKFNIRIRRLELEEKRLYSLNNRGGNKMTMDITYSKQSTHSLECRLDKYPDQYFQISCATAITFANKFFKNVEIKGIRLVGD